MVNDNKPNPLKKPTQAMTPAQLDHLRYEGYREGLDRGRQDMIDWLQHAYLDDPGRPDRGTPKADAILEVARAGMSHIKSLKLKEKKK
jgi:hypothetical protein